MSSLSLLRLTLLTALGGCAPEPCEDGETILVDGEPSGYEHCPDGAINRVEAVAVNPEIPDAACVGDEESRSCESDAECTDGPHGKCVTGTDYDYYYYDSVTTCTCAYSCADDSECGAGEVCVPPGIVETDQDYPTCQPAECLTNDDCDSGECGIASYQNGCWLDTKLACRQADDACRSDLECDDGTCWDTGGYQCVFQNCDIGRPLLVDDMPRTAPTSTRTDWAASLGVADLPAEVRVTLADYWAGVAALEHASIGSFARFTLQLLALGAPADLLADTQAAAADEVRHARIAYGLATAYGGQPVGPGALSLVDAAPALDARSVMRGLILEACVSETLGAAELCHAADGCADATLAELLREIGEDEARHAALAWRALKWLLGEHPGLRDEARKLLAEAASPGAAGPDLPAWGVPGPAARLRTHAAALRTVVGPCARFVSA